MIDEAGASCCMTDCTLWRNAWLVDTRLRLHRIAHHYISARRDRTAEVDYNLRTAEDTKIRMQPPGIHLCLAKFSCP